MVTVKMDTYLMMLYVSLDQETALKQFFLQNGWQYCRPDLSIVTDNIGPHVSQVPRFEEKFTVAGYNPGPSKPKRFKWGKTRKRKAELIEQPESPEPDPDNASDVDDNDTYEEVQSDNTDEYIPKMMPIPKIKVELEAASYDNDYGDYTDKDTDYNPKESGDGIKYVDNKDNDPDYFPKDDSVDIKEPHHDIEVSADMSIVDSVLEQTVDGNVQDTPISQTTTPGPLTSKKRRKMGPKTPSISMIEGEVGTSTTKVSRRKRQEKDKVYSRWTMEDMCKAFQAVQEGMPVKTAARMYNVPGTTLIDRTSGRINVDSKRNRRDCLLTDTEEKGLMSHINQMFDIGHGYTMLEVRHIGRQLALSLGKIVRSKDRLTQEWFSRFQKKWGEVRVIKARRVPVNEVVCMDYFRELGTIYTDNDIADNPARIFTVQETKLDIQTGNEVLNVTVIASGNALGNQVPPYYVFPGKEWDDELLQDAYTGTDGEMTEDGCSNSGVIFNYITNHFGNHIQLSQEADGEKTLILFDEQNLRHLPSLKKWADQNNVVLFALPPRSKHLTESIDVTFHEMFGKMYHLEYQLNKEFNPEFLVTLKNITKFIARPYADTMSTENLSSAFRKAGIYPLDNTVIKP